MIARSHSLRSAFLAAAALLAGSSVAHAVAITKSATALTTDLTLAASWGAGSGPVPGSADVATWSGSSLNAGLTMATNLSWQGIDIQGAAGAIGITGAGRLTLGSSGINIASLGQNLTLGNTAFTMGAAQNWNIASGKTLTISPGNTSGNFGGTGKITVQGAGTVVLSAAANAFQNFAGGWQIDTGAEVRNSVTNGSAGGSAAWGTQALVLNGGTASFNQDAFSGWNNAITVSANSTIKNYSGGSFDRRHVLTGAITASAGTILTFENAGRMTANGLNGFMLGNNNANFRGTINVGNGGTTIVGLVMGGTNSQNNSVGTAGNLASDAIVDLKNGSGKSWISLSHDSGSWTFAAKIQGAGDVFAGSIGTGPQIVTVSGANAYTGTTTVSKGTLVLGNATALGTTAAGTTVTSGAVLDLNAQTVGAEALTLSGTGISSGGALINSSGSAASLSGAITLAAASSVGGSGDFTLSGAIGGAFDLTKVGAGALTLSGANTAYANAISVSAGTLKLGNAAALGTAAAGTSIASGAVLDLNGQAVATAEALTLNGTGISSGGALINSGGAASYAGLLTLGSASSIVAGSGDITLSNVGTITGDGLGLTVGGAKNTSIASIIGTGAGTLTKEGAGTLTLSGANTYTGLSTVNAGALVLSGGAAIADTGAVSLANVAGVSMQLGASETIGSLAGGGSSGGNVDLQSYKLTVGDANNAAFAGVLGGTGGQLTKQGTGALTLSAANSYTGATRVANGTLNVTGSLAAGSSVTVASGATLAGSGTVGGGVTVENGGALAAGSAGSGVLTLGSLTLGANAGDASTISIGVAAGATASSLQVNGDVVINGGAGSVTFAFGNGLNSLDTGTYSLLAYTGAQLADITPFGYSGAKGARQGVSFINGTKSVSVKIDTAYPIWKGTTTNWSALTAWKLNTDGTDTAYLSGDTVRFDSTASGSGVVELTADVDPVSITFDNDGTLAYTLGSSTGKKVTAGFVNKTGVGVATLSSANSYAGDTTVSAGTLRIGDDAALGTGTLALNGGAFSSDSTTARTVGNAVTIGGDATLGDATNSGALTLSGAVNLGLATRQLTVASAVTLSGVVSSGGLTKAGASTLTLTGVNTYTGATSVSNGTLEIGGAGQLGSGSYAGAIGNTATLKFNTTASQTLSGVVSGTGELVKDNTGTLTLTGVNTYSGATTISNGTLEIGGFGQLGSGTYAGAIGNAGTLRFNSTASQMLSGAISGTGAVVKSGAGQLTLSGNSSYSGATTISAGTLTLGHANALGGVSGSVVTVNTGATLDLGSVAANIKGIVLSGTGTVTNTSASAGKLTLGSGGIDMSAATANLTLGGTGFGIAIDSAQVWNVASGRTLTVTPANANGNFSGTAGNRITVRGSGVVVLTGAASAFQNFAGGWQIDAGAEVRNSISNGSATGSAAWGTQSLILNGGTASFNDNAYSGWNNAITVSANSTIKNYSASLTRRQLLSGSITAAAGTVLTFENAGSMDASGGFGFMLDNNNVNFHGTINVGNGTSGSTVGLLFGGSDSQYYTADNVGNLASDAIVDLKNGTGKSVVGFNRSGTWTFASKIQGSGDVIVGVYGGSSQVLTLSGANTYTGLTKLSAAKTVVSSLNKVVGGEASSNLGAPITAAAGTISIGSGAASATLNYIGGAYTTDRVIDLAGTTGGATLDLTGATGLLKFTSAFTATGAGAKTLTLAGGTGTAGEIAGAIVENSATNTTGLTKAGAGTWTLSGTNTYTGVTAIQDGSLVVTSIGNGGVAGNLGKAASAAANIVLGVNGGGTGTLAYAGSGESTDRLFTLQGNGAILNNGTGAISFTNTGNLVHTENAASHTLTLGGSYAGATNTLAAVIANASASPTALTKTGAGTWTLTAASTYTGMTAVENGTLILAGGNGRLSASTSVTVGATGTSGKLVLGNASGASSQSLAGLSSAGNGGSVVGGNASVSTLTLDVSGTSAFSGVLGGAGSNENNLALVKSGGGTLTLSGANTFVGGTTLSAGRLNLGSASALGTGSFAISGGTIDNTSGSALALAGNNAQVWSGDFTFGGSADLDLGTGDVTLSGNRQVTVSGANLTVGGVISGAYSLSKSGAGTLTLNGINLYTGGTTLSAGKIVVGNDQALGTGSVSVLSGAILDLAGHDLAGNTIDIASGGSVINIASSTATLNVSSGYTLDSSTANFGGTLSLSSGTLTVSADNALGGSATVAIADGASIDLSGRSLGTASLRLAGTGDIINPGAILNSNTSAVARHDGAITLESNATIGGAGAIVLAGPISGSGKSLEKAGTGTLTLSGVNTYDGVTNVADGKLVINGSIAGDLTVAAGAILGGSGTIGGNAVISGIHSPGNSPGIETFRQDLTYGDGAAITWELSANTQTQGTPVVFDQIVVDGDLTFTGATLLTLRFDGTVLGADPVDWTSEFWLQSHVWTLFSVGGTITGGLNLQIDDLSGMPYNDSLGHAFADVRNNMKFELLVNNSTIQLSYSAIPEPSTYGLVLGGLALAAAAVRRRRNASSKA